MDFFYCIRPIYEYIFGGEEVDVYQTNFGGLLEPSLPMPFVDSECDCSDTFLPPKSTSLKHEARYFIPIYESENEL